MEKEIGKVSHFFGNILVAVVKMAKGSMKKGDVIKIKGGDGDLEMTVDSMQVEHKDVEEAKKGEEVGLKVPEKVHEGDAVYLVS